MPRNFCGSKLKSKVTNSKNVLTFQFHGCCCHCSCCSSCPHLCCEVLLSSQFKSSINFFGNVGALGGERDRGATKFIVCLKKCLDYVQHKFYDCILSVGRSLGVFNVNLINKFVYTCLHMLRDIFMRKVEMRPNRYA